MRGLRAFSWRAVRAGEFLARAGPAHVFDEGFAEPRGSAAFGIEAAPLGAAGGQGVGDRRIVRRDGVARVIGRKAAKPARRQSDVLDFVFVDLLEDPGAGFVPGFAKGVAVGKGEVEVRLLEGQPQAGQKGARAVGRGIKTRHLLPEIIRLGVLAEFTPEERQAFEIELAVALFVRQRIAPALSQAWGNVGPAQKCPGKEFHRHQFVVGKTGKANRTERRVGELAGPGQGGGSALHGQPRISSRPVGGRGAVGPRLQVRIRGRFELARQIAP